MFRSPDSISGRPPGLLDLVAANVGCIYLSDLHQPENWPGILKVLDQIVPQPYSLYEWSDMIHYITGSSVTLRDQTQALRVLRQFLREHSTERVP